MFLEEVGMLQAFEQVSLPGVKRVQIQEYDGKWLVPLLEAAQRNLGTAAPIGTSVIDRGY